VNVTINIDSERIKESVLIYEDGSAEDLFMTIRNFSAFIHNLGLKNNIIAGAFIFEEGE